MPTAEDCGAASKEESEAAEAAGVESETASEQPRPSAATVCPLCLLLCAADSLGLESSGQ